MRCRSVSLSCKGKINHLIRLPKILLLAFSLIPAVQAEDFELQLQRELRDGKDGNVAFEPVQTDYNYGYGTRTDVYLSSGGEVEVENHMSNGPQNEVRLYDEAVQLIPITQPRPERKELQPGVRRLWGE